MPITEPEWNSIRALVESVSADVSGARNFFTTGKVLKRDENKKLIWLEEFGDQPIPLVAFDYEVKYYDETPNGTTVPSTGASSPFKTKTKTVKAKVLVPKVGETVLVARELGTRRLPRCLGVILAKPGDWLVAEVE